MREPLRLVLGSIFLTFHVEKIMEHNEIQNSTTEYTRYYGLNTGHAGQPIPLLLGD
jgi:hypothetical protein